MVACPEGQHYLWETDENGCDIPTECVDIEPDSESGPEPEPCPVVKMQACPDGQPHVVTQGDDGCDVYVCPEPIEPVCPPVAMPLCAEGTELNKECDADGCCQYSCKCPLRLIEPCSDGQSPVETKDANGCPVYECPCPPTGTCAPNEKSIEVELDGCLITKCLPVVPCEVITCAGKLDETWDLSDDGTAYECSNECVCPEAVTCKEGCKCEQDPATCEVREVCPEPEPETDPCVAKMLETKCAENEIQRGKMKCERSGSTCECSINCSTAKLRKAAPRTKKDNQ